MLAEGKQQPQERHQNYAAADSEPERVLISTVKKWRFKPAFKDGVPVASHATLEFFLFPGK